MIERKELNYGRKEGDKKERKKVFLFVIAIVSALLTYVSSSS